MAPKYFELATPLLEHILCNHFVLKIQRYAYTKEIFLLTLSALNFKITKKLVSKMLTEHVQIIKQTKVTVSNGFDIP